MANTLRLEKYSIGVGDRFAREAEAQLRACQLAVAQGADVIPVWNKSNREHLIIGSDPATARVTADRAVRALGWDKPYHVDADHIRLETVDRFIPHADFFTIDVADWIGRPAEASAIRSFVQRHSELAGTEIPEIDPPLRTTVGQVKLAAAKYLLAVREAGRIHRHITRARAGQAFITEVSMDETELPQAPVELLVILAALADEGIPVQAIAPKFTGRFNKGVDYAGDVERFEKEFREDLSVIALATARYALPPNLKLSVHSGSDKFSIYPAIRRSLEKTGAGLHLKTAGTTWLAELIGLAESGGAGLDLVKDVYAAALARRMEFCEPYAAVIDIDPALLPGAETVRLWDAEQFVSALRHDNANPHYNPHLRQLLHVGFKAAAAMGTRYLDALEMCRDSVARNVTDNLFHQHLRPVFLFSENGRRAMNPA